MPIAIGLPSAYHPYRSFQRRRWVGYVTTFSIGLLIGFAAGVGVIPATIIYAYMRGRYE